MDASHTPSNKARYYHLETVVVALLYYCLGDKILDGPFLDRDFDLITPYWAYFSTIVYFL